MLIKKMVSFLFIVLASLSLEATEPYDEVVGLGYSCEIAYQLEHNGIRTLAYPFDWVHTSHEALISFITNKGKNFFDIDKIHVVEPYPGDPVCLQVVDLVYGIISYHDFYTSPYMGNYKAIKSKYNRRISRFFDLLNSKKRVLFVRQGALKEQVEFLDDLIHRHYPRLAYTIIAINNTEEYKENWGLSHVENFYMEGTPGDWRGNQERWFEILSQFTIKSKNAPRDPAERW